MDYKPLPVGFDNFEMLITRGYYFIDKTQFIQELIDKKGFVTLFTRPGRFGKTLNISMLQYFFEDARDRDGNKIDHSHLFKGLKIMRAGEQYLSHMGQYPVINLSLKSGRQPDFDMAYQSLRFDISREYDRHGFVAKSGCLDKYYGRKAIILIDEYDVPLENAFFEGFYKEMLDFIRAFFESALKTNSSLEFAVITGCLRISKESIFTGLNNLDIISILNKNYGQKTVRSFI